MAQPAYNVMKAAKLVLEKIFLTVSNAPMAKLMSYQASVIVKIRDFSTIH